MFTGIVHRDENGTFWFDDRPVRTPDQIPTTRSWKGTTWYAPPGIRSSDWSAIMRPGDEAFGPEPGKVVGVSFRVGKRGRMRVLSSSTWGVNNRDPNDCFRAIRSLMAAVRAVGMKVRTSVAATALQVYMDRYDGQDGRPRISQLPCRWRGLAHAAMHGGPIAVLKGGAPYAVQIDVSKAYLHALRQPVPSMGTINGQRYGGYVTHDDKRWSKLRNRIGFVEATVRINSSLCGRSLPPLPLHTSHYGVIFPLGNIRGVWTIAQVEDAERRGEIEVEKVHQFCFASVTQPLFAELADLFHTLPLPIQKRLYTRFWGKLGSRGGYSAIKSDDPIVGTVPATGLWWSFDGIDLESAHAPKTYRPDIAALISSTNHRNVLSTARRLSSDSIVACHVDSIWTTDTIGAAKICASSDGIGSWRKKRSGPLRFYGTGCYAHNGRVAASGYDSSVLGKLTEESVEAWAEGGRSQHRRLLLKTRIWQGDPATDKNASSRPYLLDMDLRQQQTEGPSVYDPCWTVGGWMRRRPDPEN